MLKLQHHDRQIRLELQSMTIIRTDDIDDLLPSEYQEPWPPLSDEEIEERERQAEFQDYLDSIPDSAERNRNLK
jgi:hypothetical protein